MKIIGKELFQELGDKAAKSPRKRAHHNLHETLEDGIHRLCIAVKPDSYIRPHRHSSKDKWELLVVLKGSVSALVFDDNGTLKSRIELVPGGDTVALEIEENTFHCFVSNSPDTVVMEVKKGPYEPISENDSLPYSPAEGDEKVSAFLEWTRSARPGDKIV